MFSFLIATLLILAHLFAIKFHFELDWEKHMESISSFNNMIVLLIIWLMFSSAVITVTLLANNQATIPWLEVIRGFQIYLWFVLGCHVDDKIRQQVERTDLLIIKYLIDFQADPSRKSVLQTFRVLVTTNRLQFNACNLYHINYTTLLGTVVSVITYSIISIQLL
ncbi:uncharacterized protein LOC121740450 [Aricia agestis]|uniref:uncharacterized protein LOC121740450 n=1 Tax=Aricia agestis TaxID=91739 RepID=UPI001C20398E|nr:uncharacterized protein LOC121740450 [Aricia agestis]